MKYKSFR